MYYDGGFSAGNQACNSLQLMTKLNIRKNLASILVNTASAVENAKLPTKEGVNSKLHDIRCRAAAFIMPNDMAFILTPKENIK